MKKKISVFLVVAILCNCIFFSASAATLYASDGRKIEVDDSKVSEWVNVGWHEGEKLYAQDGRSIVVNPFDVQKWINVGWYKAKKLYSPNGKTTKVSPFDTQKWIDVGWYSYPVTYMYDSEGKKSVVAKSDIQSYIERGLTLTYDATGHQITDFMKYLTESVKNDTSALKCLNNYLKYDSSTYLTLFWDYLDNSYEAVNKAYNMSLKYTNLNPATDDLKKMIDIYDSIYDGEYTIYTITSAFGKIIKYQESLTEFMKLLV